MKSLTFPVTVILILLALGLGIFLFKTSPSDLQEYELLTKSSSSKHSKAESLAFSVKQDRVGVHKEIYLIKGSERREVILQSPTSQMIIENGETSSDIVEKMKDADCWMQERLYYEGQKPMQEMRHLKAKQASFSYQSAQFVANDVALFRFLNPGHILDTQTNIAPVMKGKAKEVHFSLNGSDFNFKADRLKATFYQKDEP